MKVERFFLGFGPTLWSFRRGETEYGIKAFPLLDLAVRAGRLAGTAPAVLNAANEEAVAAFLAGRLPFPGIAAVVARVLDEHRQPARLDLQAVLAAERWSRDRARTLVEDLIASRGTR